jgi:hypothetical protein
MRYIVTAILCVGLLTSAPVRANVITENYTIAIPSGSLASNPFDGSSITLFNPSLGTLTSVTDTLTGAATWDSMTTTGGNLTMTFTDLPSGQSSSQSFTCGPGPLVCPINIDLTVTTPSTFLSNWLGTTPITPSVINSAGSITGIPADTLSATTPLSGTVAFTYTPATAPAPEPSSLAILAAALGLVYLGLLSNRRHRRPNTNPPEAT